jgi:hypothetical protein
MANGPGALPRNTLGSIKDEDPVKTVFTGRNFLGAPGSVQSTYGTAAQPSFVFFEDKFEVPEAPEPTAPVSSVSSVYTRRDPVKYVDTSTVDDGDPDDEDDEVGVDPDSAPGMGPDVGMTDTAEDVGGDEGDSKIICTAMNSMYGFGGFRNAIWMKYQASHPSMKKEEYELGYHKLIMPLVKRMKTSKFIRTIVEFNARQRTFNLRREMRGQETTLYYRIVEKKIILPAFFAIGWLVKKNILKKAKI